MSDFILGLIACLVGFIFGDAYGFRRGFSGGVSSRDEEMERLLRRVVK